MPPENDDKLEEKTPEEIAAEETRKKAEEEERNRPRVGMTREELDELLKARDASIMSGIRELLGGVQKNDQKTDEKIEERKAELNITAQDFYNDPMSALNKFFDIKTAPLREAVEKTGKPTPETLKPAIDVQRMKLKDRYGEDQWKKYEKFFDQVAAKTDPRILADEMGTDSVWRLARSYADDYFVEEERKRQERGQRTNLETGTKKPDDDSKKVTLTDDEKQLADAMGLTPELYKQYSGVEEIEIGANRKKAKK